MFNYAQLCLINVILQTFSFKLFKKYFFFLSILNFRTFEALPQTHDQVIVLAQLFDVVDLLHLLVHVADVEVEEDRRGDDGDDLRREKHTRTSHQATVAHSSFTNMRQFFSSIFNIFLYIFIGSSYQSFSVLQLS